MCACVDICQRVCVREREIYRLMIQDCIMTVGHMTYLDSTEDFVHYLQALVLEHQLTGLVALGYDGDAGVDGDEGEDNGDTNQEGHAQLSVQEVEGQRDLNQEATDRIH